MSSGRSSRVLSGPGSPPLRGYRSWFAPTTVAVHSTSACVRYGREVHPRFRTPHRAILLQAGWASVLVWTGTYRQLFTRVIFTEWAFFAAMAVGVFILRRRADYRPSYRIRGYPWVPIIFIVASLAIVINRLRSEPLDSAIGLALVALGIPVYYAWRHFHPRVES